ncbi:unnamed protein product [Thelazia callipaeda]|uniref:SH3 domain-containing protein n=1 Tax=Thelazia callipaeda TaxID=103827 RepID=A0A0N5CVC8_THECL|nr:unnamed protein product [Thelazia callipaeda]
MVEGAQGDVTLRSLIENEIPDSRANLENSYANLERVAAYCEANYAQAQDKRAAFDETRRYAVQSLASVAYQVNTLAYALLHSLDLQTGKINNMVSQINSIEEIISIHKEKVARREIGLLTVNKYVQKQPKVVAVGVQEPVQRYQSTPIDYSVLDNLGHGVKIPEPINRSFIMHATSTVSQGSSNAHFPIFPNFEQLLPKANITATLSRSATARGDHYRTPQIAATPVIDPQRFSTITHAIQNYSTISAAPNYGTINKKRDSQQSMPLPPPQLAPVAQYRLSTNSLGNVIFLVLFSDGLPPPPTSVMMDDEPLPPPPIPTTVTPIHESGSSKNISGSSANECSSLVLESAFDRSYEWIPKVYIEKAIALYDYEAEKPDELTLRENCIVYVLRKNDDGWFEGVLNGCTGLFPGNYVQAIN